MARHFVPSVVERKSHRRLQRQTTAPLQKPMPRVSCWFFRVKPKPTDVNQTYMVSLDKKVDPNVFHENINRLILGATVKVDDPHSPQSFFIILLPEPLPLHEIVSKTQRVFEELP